MAFYNLQQNANMKIRIVLALHVHDGELSALLHRDPSLKNNKSVCSVHATYRSFEANTALNWISSARQEVE